MRKGHTVLEVSGREEYGEETTDGGGREEHAIVVERIEGDGTLAHVKETLSHSHSEQVIRVLVVVLCQCSQHVCHTCIIGT